MYPWKSVIAIRKNVPQPVYLQIVNTIIQEIMASRLAPGQKLPGARTLADMLSLNRKTVTAAMEELESQGWIENFEQKGAFISTRLPITSYRKIPNDDEPAREAAPLPKIAAMPELELLRLDLDNCKLIDDGIPDVRLAPMKDLFRQYRSLAEGKAFSSLLRYNPVEGDIGLRTTLSAYLRETRGINAGTDRIFITSGSQMGIYLTLAVVVTKGDNCISSFPGYTLVDNIVRHHGGNIIHVPVDEDGIVTEKIEEICRKKKIKLIYVSPHHHYPTTVVLSPERRMALMKLAEKYNFFILEDDYDYDFHYENSPVLPLAGIGDGRRVIYTGSFSKCTAPAMRVGYFVAPAAVIDGASKLRRVIDRQGHIAFERALAGFIRDGDLPRHIRKAKTVYKLRRDLFCELVAEQLGDQLSFTKPEGGMAVWLTFRKKIPVSSFLDNLKGEGYALDSEEAFLMTFNSMRIGFSALNEKEMKKVVEALRNAIKTTRGV